MPVVDLRLKFGMSRTESTVNTCIIITEVEMDGEAAIIGALADSVQEVLEIEPARIDPPPKMGTAINPKYIRGMGKHNEAFVIILDVNSVFSAEELTLAARAHCPEEAPAA